MANPVDQLKFFLKRCTLQQRLALAGSGTLVLVLMWMLVHFVNRVEFQTLYADLDPQEAQSIVQRLEELKIPFQLETDGRTVKVAADKLPEVRIQMASQGMPESGRVGFEIFDRTNFGLTNFQEQVNYQRALEGELARSIRTLVEVEAARVHLVLAKDSLFQTADEQTKASVILKLKSGRTLSPAAAQGIVNMVASSVKGLMPEKVVLIDYRGKVLSRNYGGDSGLSAQQLDAQQKLETELSAKIIQILEPAVGQGKVRPQVSVVMNFQQVEETVEQYDPQGSVVRSRQNETTNYEVSKSVRHVVSPIGKIDRVSVAVIIDNHTKVAPSQAGQPQTTQVPHTADEMKKYKELVSAAIGFNPERGDQLTIENISFEGEMELVEVPTFLEKQGPIIITGLRYLIIPVVFIVLYLLLLRPVQRTVLANWVPPGTVTPRTLSRLPGPIQTPMTVKQLEAQLNGIPAAEEVPGPEAYAPAAQSSRIDMIRKRVVEQAQADPETVAKLVRVWLSDERKK